MAFGPLIGGSSGGGGGGVTVATATVSTGNVPPSSDVDISFPLPAGITGVTVVEVEITRTAGDSTRLKIEMFGDDARAVSSGYLMGGTFDGIDDVGADPVYGPALVFSGTAQPYAIPYKNTDGSEFLRATFTNNDGANAGTFDITLKMIPVS